MCVDDDYQIIKVFKEMLEYLKYSVDAYTEPKKALLSFKENPYKYNLIITDYKMPYINGLELITEMYIIRSNIPTMIVTGFFDQINQINLEEKGINRLLNKPFNINTLAYNIREVLDNYKEISSR